MVDRQQKARNGGISERHLPRKATAQSLRNAALFYLQRYATSAENLRRVLMRRVERAAVAHGSDVREGVEFVNEIIIRYRETGLLDDLVYAKAQTQSLRRRGHSLRMIQARLQAKGVAHEHIELALTELELTVTDADLSAAVIIARRRRLGPWRLSDRVDRRMRDLATLAKRGFSYTISKQVIDAESTAHLEELLRERSSTE
jgi:regulatory protein